MNIRQTISRMTLEEKIAYCTGADFWHTVELPRLGIPAMKMSDGPHGVRCQQDGEDMLGINKSLPATCFPTAVTACSTWNPELYGAEAEAIGREALACGVSLVLGPGCNIKRNPLGGRNFEYLSEDPYLAGKMAASFVQNQQKTGARSCLKHFAANNQEYKRQNGDSQVDERTLRELYLVPFEMAVREASPAAVMCSYNQINGVFSSDNRWLLTDLLRQEWGFDGAVVTDWGAMNDRIAAMEAGCDLNMPGANHYMEAELAAAVRSGLLDEACIDTCVERILRLVEGHPSAPGPSADVDAHHRLALEVARQGAVLLKNEDGLLPVPPEDMVLVGHMAAEMRYQGSGSSHINPTRLVQLADALPQVPRFSCCDSSGAVTEESLAEAARLAAQHRVAVVVAGLPDVYESEAFDRSHLSLPEGHSRMIEAVAAANPNTVVVLLGGGPVELPWADRVKAILYMGLPGQAGGQAMADLLCGTVNPSGKLSESWPLSYADVISKDTFGRKNTEYREGLYVGYRYYDKAGKAVRYPFGHGLSYTRFEYGDLAVHPSTVSLTVTNTGSLPGAEVVQLYIAPPQDGLHRPKKELKGFARVELQPGECKTVSLPLDERSFALWDGGWKVPGGTYDILVGSSCGDIRLQGRITLPGSPVPAPSWQAGGWYETMEGSPTREEWEHLMGHPVPVVPEAEKGGFTMNSTCAEMAPHSFVMRIQYRITEHIIAKSFGGKKDLSDPAYRMMLTAATDCPMRSVVISSGGTMSSSMAKGLLHMANGRWLKGLAALWKK